MKVPIVMQMHSGENGAAALAMILAHHKKYLPMETIRERCLSSRNGSSLKQLHDAAAFFGLDAQMCSVNLEGLKELSFPVIACWKRKHYVVIRGFKKGRVLLNDPAKGVYSVTEEKFQSVYTGKILTAKPGADFEPGGKPTSILKMIFWRISHFKRSSALIVLLHSISILVNLAVVVLAQHMIDEVIGVKKFILYVPILSAMLVAFLVTTSISILRTLYAYKTSRKMAAVSSSKLFKKLISLPMKFFDQHYIGDIMERLDTNATLDHALLNTISPSIVDGCMIFVYLGLMMYYDPVIASICFIFEIIYIIASIMLQEKVSTISHSLNASSGALGASLLNGLSTIDTIKSVGEERNFFSIWSKSQAVYQSNGYKILKAKTSPSLFHGWHAAFTSTTLLFVGAFFIAHGNFTLGMFSSFQSVLSYLKSSMRRTVQTMTDLSSIRSNIERVDDILMQDSIAEVPINNVDEVDHLTGTIDIENVVYYYDQGDKPAVNGITLHVKKGEMVALVGPTGCGKSTLLKLIASLYQPQSGTIKYGGRTRDEIPDVVFYSSVSTVDQEIMLFEDSISANLKLWDETIKDDEMISAAKSAQIHDRILEDRNGYRAQVLENGGNYSVGEQQRMELARALSHDPSILLLDEFTSALDAITEERVFKAIRKSGITCILAAHRMSTVSSCDQIIVIDKGKIVEHGTHDELYKANGRYRELMDKQ